MAAGRGVEVDVAAPVSQRRWGEGEEGNEREHLRWRSQDAAEVVLRVKSEVSLWGGGKRRQ